MRRMLTILIVALLVLSVGSAGMAAAAAARAPVISIGVAPSKLQAHLVPGQLYRTQLDVYNKGNGPLVLDAYLQDYTISPDSAVVFKPAGALATSAAAWATLGSGVVRLAPHGRAQVQLAVRVSKDAALGTHALAFRSRQVKTDVDVDYRPAVASLMAAAVQHREHAIMVAAALVALIAAWRVRRRGLRPWRRRPAIAASPWVSSGAGR